nr:hypothetical protein [Mucilaginibacter sp. SP1R1]
MISPSLKTGRKKSSKSQPNNRTNAKVWNAQQIKQARGAIDRIAALNPSPNTNREIANFRSLLTLAAKGR